MDLAELDLLLGVVVVGRAQDDEERLLVVLHLRALVADVGVLEGELVEVEARADVAELLRSRLEQPEPDEVAVADDAARGDLERQLALVLAPAVAVVGAIDDHAATFPPPRRASCPRAGALRRARRGSGARSRSASNRVSWSPSESSSAPGPPARRAASRSRAPGGDADVEASAPCGGRSPPRRSSRTPRASHAASRACRRRRRRRPGRPPRRPGRGGRPCARPSRRSRSPRSTPRRSRRPRPPNRSTISPTVSSESSTASWSSAAASTGSGRPARSSRSATRTGCSRYGTAVVARLAAVGVSRRLERSCERRRPASEAWLLGHAEPRIVLPKLRPRRRPIGRRRAS